MNFKLAFVLFALLLFSPCFGQNQQPEKPIHEIASEQADLIRRDLNLNDVQVFYLDSILLSNFEGVTKEIEELRAAGRQNDKTYEEIRKKWQEKTLNAVERVFDKKQFEKYMKVTGVSSKERKQRLKAWVDR